MHIAPATQSSAAAHLSAPTAPASQAPHASAAAGHSTRSAGAPVTPQEVSAAILQRALGDGDGRTGAAALNDGDAAAQQAKSSVDVRA